MREKGRQKQVGKKKITKVFQVVSEALGGLEKVAITAGFGDFLPETYGKDAPTFSKHFENDGLEFCRVA